ncbi:iron ABC transporter permease [Salinicola sp. JS01]|uniref:FecCD family ABC transporter permease n=1 Tax=Salinicola sp. JS01 TaxID=3050071 RepID=UPI00255BCCC5|nr:iron ABC transporter permease [Salinicola sp. JS01]WIX31271.1 iron ABC transporter permease [Salinicola sp. JS01]
MGEARALRLGPFSRVVTWRAWRRVALALLVVLLILLASLALGEAAVSAPQWLVALRSPDSGAGLILWQLRLPRTLLGALVGAALALSGWLLQQVMRNPLASPDTLGVTAGAATLAVGYLAFLAADVGTAWMPLAAALGALLAVLLVMLAAWRGGATPLRLVLMGIGLSTLLSAVTTFVLVSSPLTTTLSAYVWLTGSVYGGNWSDVGWLAACFGVALVALMPLVRLALLAPLDDGLAVGIGVRVQWTRTLLILLAAGLAGIAVAWGGAMAFVGLVAPHVARLLLRQPGAAQIVMAILVGAGMTMAADLAGRLLFPPLDLPAGLFVAAIGAPFFLGLMMKQAR